MNQNGNNNRLGITMASFFNCASAGFKKCRKGFFTAFYKNFKKNRSGFTLVETIIAIFIFLTVGLAMAGIYANLFTVSNKNNSLTVSQDYARKLSSQILNQLRNSLIGSDGSYPLYTAGDQQIVFYSNVDNQPGTERIRYYLQGGKIYRGITVYSAGTYNTSTEVSLMVQDNVANSSTTPLFYYYNGNYNGSSSVASLAQPVNVTQVRYVSLNLQIYNTGGLKNTNYYTVSGGAAIRGLKTNLGQ